MSLLLPRLRRVRVEAEGLTATQWSSPQDKAKLANAILAFVAKGLPEEGFSKALYQRISQMWGFIACFNRNGFAGRYFSTTQGRLAFLDQIIARGGIGIPPGPGQTWKAGSRLFWSSIRCRTCTAPNCGRRLSEANRRCCAG